MITSKVMLFTEDLDKFLDNIKNDSRIMYSPKLDGVRCWAIVDKDKIYYLSRNNKLFPNFHVFDEMLEKIVRENNLPRPFIFDGEVTSADKKFNNVMTQIRRLKDIDASIFRYHIFDLPISGRSFEARYLFLKKICGSLSETTPSADNDKDKKIFVVPHKKLKYVRGIKFDNIKLGLKELMNRNVALGYEGIILRDKNAEYDFGKRSISGCKLKQLLTIELKVIGAEYGKGKNKNRLGALICDYKGKEIRVGGGYTDNERIEFVKNPPKVIEVAFKGFTKNGMLREPIFVRVREDKDVLNVVPKIR